MTQKFKFWISACILLFSAGFSLGQVDSLGLDKIFGK
jgi:hypothetical protein